MWNYGATQVDAGTPRRMNNMHVQQGRLINLYYQRNSHWQRLATGALVILASLWVHQPVGRHSSTSGQMIAGVIAR